MPAIARAGIEMAFLDAAGKALNRPIHSILGGAVRNRVETAAYLFYRYPGEKGIGGEIVHGGYGRSNARTYRPLWISCSEVEGWCPSAEG